MAKRNFIDIDTDEFEKSARRFIDVDFPEAMALGVKHLTRKVESATRDQTRRDFKLSTDWIPKQIRAFPRTKGQTKKIASDVRRKGKFIASVSGNAAIEFMSGHDVGMTRKRQNTGGSKYTRGKIAVPGPGLKKLNYKTSTGKIRSKYKPSALLKDYKGNRGPKTGRRRRLPFIMRSSKSSLTMIVRRESIKRRPISVLYFLVNQTKIKEDWEFTERGMSSVQNNYSKSIHNAMKVVSNRSPNRKYGK